MGKVFEKILRSHIQTHTDRNSHIPDVKFGFCSGHATTEQIPRILG